MNKADRFSSPEQDPLKAKFLQGTLQEEGEYITDFQEEVMGKFLTTRTGTLRSNRGFNVTQSGEGFKLDMRFVKYLRFIDIHGKEGAPKEQLILYNKVIYGRLSNIANTIQFGFTDSMRELMAKAYKDLKIEI